jgi:YVTN family beta-propeller protein
MRGLDGNARENAVRLAGVLVAVAAVAGCCIGVSSAAARVINTIGVGAFPDGVSADGTHVWVTNSNEDTVSEIEASSGEVINTIGVGKAPAGVSADGTHIWVANHFEDTVSEIEASTGTVIRTIPVAGDAEGVSSDGTHVWVTSYDEEGTVSEIEASTGAVIRTIPVGRFPRGVSSDGTHVWVVNLNERTVSEIEASTGTVIRTIPVGLQPEEVSSDGTHVWVTNSNEGTVSEIEASTGTVIRTIPVPDASSVYSDGTHVWVTSFGRIGASKSTAGKVTEIEASNGTLSHTILVGRERPFGVSADGTHVWFTNSQEHTVGEFGYTAECTGSNTGTVTLSPGLKDTAAIQTMKIKGTLAVCEDEPFIEAKYTATLKTSGPVSCSVLKAAGETASGTAKFSWKPRLSDAETETVSVLLTETPGAAFSGELTTGPYSPLPFSGTLAESFTGGSTCGKKAVRKGRFAGSVVSFE